MPRSREYPSDDIEGTGVAHSSDTPVNIYDALMQAAPHTDVDDDIDSLLPVREVLNDAIENLPALERFVFDGCVVERRPLRALAVDLGRSKSGVALIRDRACALLRQALEGDPIIKGHLT